MTKVKIDINDDTCYVEAIDHADDPIVCSAITSILWALAGAVVNHCKPSQLQMNDGEVRICCPSDDVTRAYFYMASVGLRQLALAYKKNIQVGGT